MTITHNLSHDEIMELIMNLRQDAEQSGKRLMLDLFCCQGAMSAGYSDAGFIILGVDIDPKALRRYPFAKVQHDAVEFALKYGWLFDFISASPPCQDYSLTQRIVNNDFPRLIEPTRRALDESGIPYVIENVSGARDEMINPITLCGLDFGLHTYRHRLFEFGTWPGIEQPEHREHVHPTVKMGRPLSEGDFYHAVGNFQQVDYVRRDLNLPWMNRDGLRECAPRQYAQYIGIGIQNHLNEVEESWSRLEANAGL